MNKIKYNISLNVKTLKSIFEYFKMNEKNTIIKLVTKNKDLIKEAEEYIYQVDEKYVYMKNLKFEKLYYFLSKNLVFNVYYIKKDDEVIVHTMMDKIYSIEFNDKFDLNETKLFLKKYRTIHIEYIIIVILIVVGLLIRLLRG